MKKMSGFDEQKLFELLQIYRHTSVTEQKEVVKAFEAIKKFIETQIEKHKDDE